MQNFVDFLSSVVAFWRFYCPGELTKEREQELIGREERAGVAISFFILILGVLIILAGYADLKDGPKDADDGMDVIIIISFVSVLLYSVMTAYKLKYARVLNSEALFKDGLCSLIGVVLSIIICVNAWFINADPTLWKMDATMAMVCGGIALGIGFHGIFYAYHKQGLPIFSFSWWWNNQDKEKSVEVEDEDENTDKDKTQLSGIV